MKWSAANITFFLEMYMNFELLWNIQHIDYTNKSKQEIAIMKLKDELVELGIAVGDLNFLRARIKSIKSTYRS